PLTIPQTVPEAGGRFLLPSYFSARADHSVDSTSPSSNGVLRFQVSCQVRNCTRCTLVACGELTRAPSTRTPSFNAAAAGAGGRTGARRGSGVTPPSQSSSSTARTAASTIFGHWSPHHCRSNLVLLKLQLRIVVRAPPGTGPSPSVDRAVSQPAPQ